MSGYRHRTAESYNGSSLLSNEPEGASSTASSEYDRYYWKNVHNPHKVLKMRHYFGGMESDAADRASPDALTRAKSMPSLEKWTPHREWGLAHKGTSVSELRARFEKMESQVAPQERRSLPESRQRAMRRARSTPRLERASPEPRIVPQRRAVAASERRTPRSVERSWTPEEQHASSERCAPRTHGPQVNGAARSPDRGWTPEELRFREQMARQKAEAEAHAESPEWMSRASEMKARWDAKEEQRMRAMEAYLREPVVPPEFSSRRRGRTRADSDSTAPSLPSTDPPSAIVIDSVQLRSAASAAPVPAPRGSPPRAPPEPKAPIADWRYHYQVERAPIAGDFTRNRERFEIASKDEDEQLAQKQAQKQGRTSPQKHMAMRETDLDAPTSGPRQTHLVLARQTVGQQQQQKKAVYDPELLNPYGNEQPAISRAVISLGQKGRSAEDPRLDDFIDSVQQYARPPPASGPSGRPRDVADGSEMAWKEAQSRPATAKMLGANRAEDEAIYANINVIRQHQQQQQQLVQPLEHHNVQREQHIPQQKVQRHQLQFHQNGQRHQFQRQQQDQFQRHQQDGPRRGGGVRSGVPTAPLTLGHPQQQQQSSRHSQPRHSTMQPSQRPDRAQTTQHSKRQSAPPTQPGWEPARCVWDSRYHTWRRYDRTTNDYVITQPANRVPSQLGSSPLTESLRPMLVDLDGVTSPYDARSGALNSRGQAGISLPNGLTLYGPR